MSNADDYNRQQLEAGLITPTHLTTLTRAWQNLEGLEDDGKLGPRTRKSLDDAVRPDLRSVWPLRKLADGRAPQITSAYYTRNPSRAAPDRRHYGVDLFYRYLPGDPPMKVGDGGRDKHWWIPDGTIAVAVADGQLAAPIYVGPSRTGYRAWMIHEGNLRSGYFHLSKLLVEPDQVLKAGDPIGIVGDNPIDGDARHLHFEIYRGRLSEYPVSSLDPQPFLESAELLAAV